MKNTVLFALLFSALITFTSSCTDDDCVESTWYEDADGDELGNPDEILLACEQPSGYFADNTDTDDTDSSSTACNTTGEEAQSSDTEI